jgi:hypothetical protein
VSATGPADGQIQQQYSSMYLPPRDDINSPDMYIPIMALITYILLSTVLAGLRGKFQPELLGSITTSAVGVVILEILILKVAMWILSISNDSQLLDLVAYSGYKYVGVIVTLAVAEILSAGNGTGGWIGWTVFLYTFLANALFLVSANPSILLNLPSSVPSPQISDLIPASILEICPPSGQLKRRIPASRSIIHAGACSAQPTNTVPVHLRVHHPAVLYVAPHKRRGRRQNGCYQSQVRDIASRVPVAYVGHG